MVDSPPPPARRRPRRALPPAVGVTGPDPARYRARPQGGPPIYSGCAALLLSYNIGFVKSLRPNSIPLACSTQVITKDRDPSQKHHAPLNLCALYFHLGM